MKVNLNVSGSPMFKNYGWNEVIGLVILGHGNPYETLS